MTDHGATQSFRIPIYVNEPTGNPRVLSEPVSLGVPFRQGDVVTVEEITLRDNNGMTLPCQKKILARWPDKTIKWILLDFLVTIQSSVKNTFWLEKSKAASTNHTKIETDKIEVSQQNERLTVDTKTALIQLDTSEPILFRWFDKTNRNEPFCTCQALLTHKNGQILKPKIHSITIKESGPIKATISITGSFSSETHQPSCHFSCNFTLYAGKSDIVVDVTLQNPNTSVHTGGLWDLGDPASIYFQDFKLLIRTKTMNSVQLSYVTEGDDFRSCTASDYFEIYQESSGGKHWKSTNHINKDGIVPFTFNGYKVFKDGSEVSSGLRASPVITLKGPSEKIIICGIKQFWQNFPKALRATQEGFAIKLFPDNFPDSYELQGGEQKTHTIYLNFDAKNENAISFLYWLNNPLLVSLSPEWYTTTKVFSYFHTYSWSDCGLIDTWIKGAITGPDSFITQREVIDEYGWRNFGDIFANHEIQEQLTPPESLISHYNNQYDILYSSLIQFARTKNKRWLELASNLATHIMDIDIYRTENDRAEYNNGLFWHTNHFLDAATATHRSMSKEHIRITGASNYGGGPSLEHLYINGLITYHLFTGDTLARDTAIKMGDIVLRQLYGSRVFLENTEKIIREIIKRLRSITSKNNSLHSYGLLDGPGRGSGNSLHALLDLYALTNERKYILGAEKIIRACMHPKDDIGERNLLNAEFRWSYTIFLQALIKYIDIKKLNNDEDHMFHYSIECLNSYAAWMEEHEYPFLDAKEKLDAPNFATRSAQELRKANVLLIAAFHSTSREQTEKFQQKAKLFFERTLRDLTNLSTRKSARPMAILMQNGGIYSYFQNQNLLKGNTTKSTNSLLFNFGTPQKDSFFASLRLLLPFLFTSFFNIKISKEILWLKRRYAELRKTNNIKN